MVEKKKIKVAVGMSGGVDSSVATLLLKRSGFDVVGLFMKLWHQPRNDRVETGDPCGTRENACCDAKALMDARAVAEKIGIPLYEVDARAEFKKEIVDYFIDEYKNLRTPNPCVLCNKKIKFGWMLDFAEKIGCEYLATGHYSRIVGNSVISKSKFLISNQIPKSQNLNDKIYKLLKGVDSKKDQSYFLYQLNQNQLSKIIFPLGEMTKEETRKIAKENNLPVYEKAESQEICFIESDYRDFLKERLPKEYSKSGEIVDTYGSIIGEHNGLTNYTIGQRKNVKQKARSKKQGGEQKPLYVIGFDLKENRLIVGENNETFASEMVIKDVNWIVGKSGVGSRESGEFKAKVKIRYGAEAVPCGISIAGGTKYIIHFEQPQRAITPGQSAVFYKGDEVIGGGIIAG